ncbi:hypothetical protein CQJ94_02445 [Glycomyces fuscus]|nr:hypothetical protein CQJ94_02445 [Glycomyces fuscus]
MPAYRRHLAKIGEKREAEVDGMVAAPFSVGISLNNVARSARIALAMDPDASELVTWEAWTTWMQVSEAVFAMSTAPPDSTVERLINHRTRTLEAIPPRHTSDAGTWIDAFFLAITCRDEARVRSLCQIPVSFLKEAGERDGGGYDDYIYPWVAALQDFILNRPELGDNLYEAMRLSDPDHAEISSAENLNTFVFPPMNALYRLAEHDTEKFDEAMAQGIQLFHDYYTADEERTKDVMGAVPLFLLGVACLAYDTNQLAPDFNPDFSSDYLPKHILQRSWHGEFAI